MSSAVASSVGGRPLDDTVRARIEPHLGVDLGHVRVQQGSDAALAAHDLHARAFTSGATIFLAAGSSPTDVALMAHEATHVVQQQALPASRSTLMRDVSDFLPDVSLNDLIPDWILDGVRSAVRLTPGYLLLTCITGKDPLTDEPVAVSAERLIETLLTYGPFGAAVGAVLQSIDVLGQIFEFVTEGLAANDLTLARLERDIDAAWDEMSVGNGIAGNIAIVQRYVTALLQDVARFVESIVDRVLEIVRSVVAEVAEPLLETPEIAPVWNLAKKVLHYDPLRGVEVHAPTVEIIADFLRLIGQEQRLAQMQERGTLQETADWLDTQLGTFASLITELGTLFNDAWQAIQPQNLPDLLRNLGALAQRAFGFVQRVGRFAATVIVKILELVKHALLGWLSENAHRVPGFHLLTVILGRNPFTGEQVLRTAENLIKGFITLLPGGEATYQQLAESGVITAAAVRIEGEMARLGISLDLITGIFLGIWNTLTLDDLLDPIGAFGRILALFGEPLGRLLQFIGVVIEVVVTLILRLMNFPTELLASVISNTMQAIADIKRDPVGFLLHLLEAIKLGFIGFFDHFAGYLIDGLVSWLFRGLGQIGITRPPDLSLGSILTLILQVLGLSVEHLWEKLGQHIGAERVAMIRGALDRLSGAWAFIQEVQRDGLSAIWRYAADQLGAIWSTLLGMATEWIMRTVVVSATVKLLSFLDPTGIMAVINSCVAFFNAVQSAIEYLRDMLEVLDRYVSTLAAVAAGNVVPGAQMLERGLASIIPIAIGFLAKQVGLGNVPEKIVELIGRLREIVDRALDWLIEQALRLGQAALNALGLGQGQVAHAGDPTHDESVNAGLAAIADEERAFLVGGRISHADAVGVAVKVRREHPIFTSLNVVDGGSSWNYAWTASDGQDLNTPAEKLEGIGSLQQSPFVGRDVTSPGLAEELAAAGYRRPFQRQGRWVVSRLPQSPSPQLSVNGTTIVMVSERDAPRFEVHVDLGALLSSVGRHPHLWMFSIDPTAGQLRLGRSLRREALSDYRPASTSGMRLSILNQLDTTDDENESLVEIPVSPFELAEVERTGQIPRHQNESSGLRASAMSESLIEIFVGSLRNGWPAGWEVHHVVPTDWGGLDTISNYAAIQGAPHQDITNWWNALRRQILRDADTYSAELDDSSSEYHEIIFA